MFAHDWAPLLAIDNHYLYQPDQTHNHGLLVFHTNSLAPRVSCKSVWQPCHNVFTQTFCKNIISKMSLHVCLPRAFRFMPCILFKTIRLSDYKCLPSLCFEQLYHPTRWEALTDLGTRRMLSTMTLCKRLFNAITNMGSNTWGSTEAHANVGQ